MGLIDTHAHFIPPSWRSFCEHYGHGKPDGMPEIPAWDPSEHSVLMKRLGITKSILSITSPGTNLVQDNKELATRVSRECNEYASDLKHRSPESFGFWASLPLPFVEESLAEIEHSLDRLNADGVGLLTNYHGVYLGDERLDPIFAELDRRHAKVFIHPTGPCIAGEHGLPASRASTLKQFPDPMYEFLFDTTRCVINLFLSGTVVRFPNIVYILSHAGGTIPPVNGVNASTVQKMLQQRFFFDLAGFPFPDQIHGLLRYVDISRLLYGSDYPYTPASGVESLLKAMDKGAHDAFGNEEEWEQVLSANAQRLLEK